MTRTPDLTTIRARIMAAMVRAALTAAARDRRTIVRVGTEEWLRRGPNQRMARHRRATCRQIRASKPKLSPLHETGAGPRNPLNACAAPQLAGSPRAAIVEQPADAM